MTDSIHERARKLLEISENPEGQYDICFAGEGAFLATKTRPEEAEFMADCIARRMAEFALSERMARMEEVLLLAIALSANKAACVPDVIAAIRSRVAELRKEQ